jgi:hypothetical protein
MKLRDFLRNNPDLQFAYFPHSRQKEFNQKILIRFDNKDKTNRDKELSTLLKNLKLPYYIRSLNSCFFFVILPNFY